MTTRASGTFAVKLTPQTPDAKVDSPMARWSLDRQYHGDLEATSTGEMLSAGTSVEGSGAYVAIEWISGTLHGRRGTFALQHCGARTRGSQHLSVTVVPDSGTGQLVGLQGRLQIKIEKGTHAYELEYSLADGP